MLLQTPHITHDPTPLDIYIDPIMSAAYPVGSVFDLDDKAASDHIDRLEREYYLNKKTPPMLSRWRYAGESLMDSRLVRIL